MAERNLGPDAPEPTKKGLAAIAAANRRAKVDTLSLVGRLTGLRPTKAVGRLAAGEIPPPNGESRGKRAEPKPKPRPPAPGPTEAPTAAFDGFEDAFASPASPVAEHLAHPFSRLGAQLRFLRTSLAGARGKAADTLRSHVSGILGGEHLEHHVDGLHATLKKLAGRVKGNSEVAGHIDAMLENYNWDTLAKNLTADAILKKHISGGGKAADASHLYGSDEEFSRAKRRLYDQLHDSMTLGTPDGHRAEIGDTDTRSETPGSYLRYVRETWGDRGHHARLSRNLSPADAREAADAVSHLPATVLADYVQDHPDYTHDDTTVAALMRAHDGEMPEGHHIHATVHPSSGKIVAWHDEIPTHLKTMADLVAHKGYGAGAGESSVHHGPGGLFVVDSNPAYEGRAIVQEHGHDGRFSHFRRATGDGLVHPSAEAARAAADAAAFPEQPVRNARMGDAEWAEGHHVHLPHAILADKLEENGWQHDQHTLELLRGHVPTPEGHTLHVARHPDTRQVVAWHDSHPQLFDHIALGVHGQRPPQHYANDLVGQYHGPGGWYGVVGVRGSHHVLDRDGRSLSNHTSDVTASSVARRLAFPAERPVQLSLVSHAAKFLGAAGGALLGHATGGGVSDLAGAGAEGLPVLGAAAGGVLGHALHPWVEPVLTRLKRLISRRKATAGPAMNSATAKLLVDAETQVKQREAAEGHDASGPQTHRQTLRAALKAHGYPSSVETPEAVEAWKINAHPEVHSAAEAAKAAESPEAKKHLFRHFLTTVAKHVGRMVQHGMLPPPPPGTPSPAGKWNDTLKYLRGSAEQPRPAATGNPDLGPDAPLPRVPAMRRIAKKHFREFQ